MRCMARWRAPCGMNPSGNARGWKNQSCRRFKNSAPSWIDSSRSSSWGMGFNPGCALDCFSSAWAASGLDCAAARNAGSAKLAVRMRREWRSTKDWSFISRLRSRIEYDCNPTHPAERRGHETEEQLPEMAFRGLGLGPETNHDRTSKGYHKLSKYSLVSCRQRLLRELL